MFPGSPHDLVALHLQEVGGVKWTAAKVAEFAERLDAELLRPASETHWSTGLVIDMEPSRFTALASVLLVRRAAAARLRRREFGTGALQEVGQSGAAAALVPAAGHAFFRHEKFEGSSSRKGFLVSEWTLDGQRLCLANVHLFHDDSNLVALDASPSAYAMKRAAALRTVVQRLPCAAAVLAGDFNFRLELRSFVEWLRERAAAAGVDAAQQYVLIQKDCFVCPFVDRLMSDAALAAEVQTRLDRELARFNETQPDAVLAEERIAFPPTYPVEGPGRWSSKRAPGWCDRVLYTPAARSLLGAAPAYAAVLATPDAPLGSDHLPVYLRFAAAQ